MECWSNGVLDMINLESLYFFFPITPLLPYSNTPSLYFTLPTIKSENEIEAIKLIYNGIFPCRLFDSGRCLLRSILKALINCGRVSSGWITLSTSILDAAW